MTARPTLGRYYADVPNRLVGYLIDLLILSILAVIVAIVVSLLFGPIVDINLSSDPRVSVDEWLALLSGVMATAVGAVYFVGSWKRSGGTPGQRWLRMGLGTEADDRPLVEGLSLRIEGLATAFEQGDPSSAADELARERDPPCPGADDAQVRVDRAVGRNGSSVSEQPRPAPDRWVQARERPGRPS